MDTDIMHVLMEIGLGEWESRVYYALHKLGQSKVGPLVEESQVPDSKIYNVLDKLIKKGLAGFVIKNNVKHYQASSPRELLRLINKKRRDIEEQERAIEEKIIPEIEEIQRVKREKQEAVVFEGSKGIRSAFNYLLDTLKSGEEYYSFFLGKELLNEQVVRFFKQYHKKREEKKVRMKYIYNKKFKRNVRQNSHYRFMLGRFTDTGFPVGTIIFKNHVMTIVWENEPTAFIIKSKKNYEYYKSFFENLWKSIGSET